MIAGNGDTPSTSKRATAEPHSLSATSQANPKHCSQSSGTRAGHCSQSSGTRVTGSVALELSSDDTVAELLTPQGAGAIGVVRVRGPRARPIVDACCEDTHTGAPSTPNVEMSERLLLRTLFDAGEAVDEVIVSAVPNGPIPTIDLCTHGGTRVLERVLQVLQRHGVRILDPAAQPIDAFDSSTLIDREVNDALRLGKTETAVLFLARQRRLLSQSLAELALLAHEDPPSVRETMQRLYSAWPSVRLLLNGATVALVGPPNVGKSTLFNALAGRTVAITSPIAGTTRDWVTADLEFDGVPITLIDTPGDHATDHPLEAAAIRVGRSMSASADLRMLLQEAPDPGNADEIAPTPPDRKTICCEWRATILVETKTDRLRRRADASNVAAAVETGLHRPGEPDVFRVSALAGVGLHELRQGVLAALRWNGDCLRTPSLISERQAQIVAAALDSPDNMLYRGVVALIGEGEAMDPR